MAYSIFLTAWRIERLLVDHACLGPFFEEWTSIDILSVSKNLDEGKLMSHLRQVMTLANRVWNTIEEKNLLPETRAIDPFKIDEGAANLIFHQNLLLLATLIVSTWITRLENRERARRSWLYRFTRFMRGRRR